MMNEDMAEMTAQERTDFWRNNAIANANALMKANARIVELEDAAQERIAELEAELVSIKHKLIRLEGTQIHEVIDDFGYPVTSVTL